MTFTRLPSSVDIGQPVTVPVECFVGTVDTDPTTLSFSWDCIDPVTGAVIVPATVWTLGGTGSITKTATGRYSAIVTPTLGGTWRVRWVGTGACAFAQNGSFQCNDSPLV